MERLPIHEAVSSTRAYVPVAGTDAPLGGDSVDGCKGSPHGKLVTATTLRHQADVSASSYPWGLYDTYKVYYIDERWTEIGWSEVSITRSLVNGEIVVQFRHSGGPCVKKICFANRRASYIR